MENLINPVKILETKDWKEELSSTLIKLQSVKPVLVTSSRNKKRLSLTNFFQIQIFLNLTKLSNHHRLYKTFTLL